MAWVEPTFSRGAVNRAGKVLITANDPAQRADARRILSNWRSSHGYPLNGLSMTLRQRARQVTSTFLIASRLKRLVSIEHKLLRRQQVRATQIQDIGGCRVVLPSMQEVHALHGIYRDRSSRVFFPQRLDDYIERPKRNTGYRSLHLVYRYDSPRKPVYRNMRVEIQIRSQLQHAWANAVETVAFFKGHDLKAGEGDDRWLRFFLLMSHYIAVEEQCRGVPGIEGNFLSELRHLANVLDADVYLSGLSHALMWMEDFPDAWRFLIHLDADAQRLYLYDFKRQQEQEASEKYWELEALHQDNELQHVVLVSVDSAQELRRAYPGFFADTHTFLAALRRVLTR